MTANERELILYDGSRCALCAFQVLLMELRDVVRPEVRGKVSAAYDASVALAVQLDDVQAMLEPQCPITTRHQSR